jgi:hypothetical protein
VESITRSGSGFLQGMIIVDPLFKDPGKWTSSALDLKLCFIASRRDRCHRGSARRSVAGRHALHSALLNSLHATQKKKAPGPEPRSLDEDFYIGLEEHRTIIFVCEGNETD